MRGGGLFKELPIYVIWGFWLHRNKQLFESKKNSARLVVHLVRTNFSEIKKVFASFVAKPWQIPSFNQLYPWILFDTDSQLNLGLIYGFGIVVHLSLYNLFMLKIGVGLGSDTRDKLVTLWILLYFVKEKNIQNI